MKRFFVDQISPEEKRLSITGSEARHITKVLRMGPGDRMVLMDGKGLRFQAVIESASGQEVRVRLEEALPMPPLPPVEIVLGQSLLKSNAMDYMVQKTSELGVSSIFPFVSERTVVKVDRARLDQKLNRWNEISRSAAKQSDKDRPAHIAPVARFDELVERMGGEEGIKMILWEKEEANDLKALIRHAEPPGRTIALVGPEGGLTKKEVSLAGRSGFVSISLGNRILRAETAAIALVSVIQYEWGDLSLGRATPYPSKSL